MINICQHCGHYRADKIIDPSGPVAICPECGHAHPFRHLPLPIVCGPSTGGKTTVCERLVGPDGGLAGQAVLLDGDILWRAEFNNPADDYRGFFETWLCMGKNINQSGVPLVLFNSGAIPGNIEYCVERRYFTETHYLALVCADETLAQRLHRRPAWRESNLDAFIGAQRRFNRWLWDQADVPDSRLELLDTTELSIADSVDFVRRWIRTKLGIV